ncbi:nuclear speckle splicing regulatory protein 1-like [Palaemon carinicauda]|uniref:nuclear speckle splicing regulatory protein 1-like n=1 Tax=Palaemon carinicauda TaxID=392227 RepID=UPI0035B64122
MDTADQRPDMTRNDRERQAFEPQAPGCSHRSSLERFPSSEEGSPAKRPLRTSKTVKRPAQPVAGQCSESGMTSVHGPPPPSDWLSPSGRSARSLSDIDSEPVPADNKRVARQDPKRQEASHLDIKRRKVISQEALDDGQLSKCRERGSHDAKHQAPKHNIEQDPPRQADKRDAERQADKRGAERQADKRGAERQADKRGAERQADKRGAERQADKRGAERQADKRGAERQADKRGAERQADKRGAERQADKRGAERQADKRGAERQADKRDAERRDDPGPIDTRSQYPKELSHGNQDVSTSVRAVSEEGIDNHLSPIELLEEFSEGEDPKTLHPSFDLKKLMRVFTEEFPDYFLPVAPRSPPSEFTLGKAAKESHFTKMVLSRSSKRALKMLGD